MLDEQYNVPTGDAEEEAIASRALHSKDHKDFANCELSRSIRNLHQLTCAAVKQIVHDLY
jgi:hypothetical protein